ncbi:tRNA (adenosine(37)-N6)-threonylcarbamoyltransferase complex dimerization subunit type 1 TsaB [Salinimicrobium sp. CDJ15-91]|uniref:tRNA (Adenosine(37)-N6)-threonylcarbamoyltransferase complex dimerization subunit type 1 TsaB n=1 Tax=Salinimicrobium oceani TaxID=2722702 RepID=A0ABX1D1K1_9FLAO|nr:tRNA (adenosine(37)-N6)-threonylcarbamoyltransferase complex dimerization subunit type 1 TsaB [Salinimicrobium oceani]
METATTNCSVSIGNKGKLLALKEDYSSSYSHAERLHLFIDEILKENGLKPQELSAVAVSKGPGSYTGLRIGVSAAKGLCFALDLPLIAVPTLKTLALQVKQEKEGFIIPLLDARRMEVYTTGFNSDYRRVFDTRAEILTENSFSEYLENAAVSFIGSGVEKFRNICKHENATFIEGKLPSAAQMVALAEEKFQKKKFVDVAYFEPYYLKDFVAS